MAGAELRERVTAVVGAEALVAGARKRGDGAAAVAGAEGESSGDGQSQGREQRRWPGRRRGAGWWRSEEERGWSELGRKGR